MTGTPAWITSIKEQRAAEAAAPVEIHNDHAGGPDDELHHVETDPVADLHGRLTEVRDRTGDLNGGDAINLLTDWFGELGYVL